MLDPIARNDLIDLATTLECQYEFWANEYRRLRGLRRAGPLAGQLLAADGGKRDIFYTISRYGAVAQAAYAWYGISARFEVMPEEGLRRLIEETFGELPAPFCPLIEFEFAGRRCYRVQVEECTTFTFLKGPSSLF